MERLQYTTFSEMKGPSLVIERWQSTTSSKMNGRQIPLLRWIENVDSADDREQVRGAPEQLLPYPDSSLTLSQFPVTKLRFTDDGEHAIGVYGKLENGRVLLFDLRADDDLRADNLPMPVSFPFKKFTLADARFGPKRKVLYAAGYHRDFGLALQSIPLGDLLTQSRSDQRWIPDQYDGLFKRVLLHNEETWETQKKQVYSRLLHRFGGKKKALQDEIHMLREAGYVP